MEGYIAGGEYALINKIADRAVKELGFNKSTAFLDVSLCHEHASRLRLKDLSEAAAGDFAHDIRGINFYLDHVTRKLKNNFLPRFAE